MTLSLTLGFLLWFFSPGLRPRFTHWMKMALLLVVAYELSRILYYKVFGLT